MTVDAHPIQEQHSPMTAPTPSNTELIARCRRGDGHAWQLLVDRYGRLVHSVPVRYGLASQEVDDVGQEVFWALAKQLDQIEDAERLPAWLMTTARRICWRTIQRRKLEQPAAEGDVGELDDPAGTLVAQSRMPTFHELQVGWERQEVLHAGFAKLGSRCRDLLNLIFLDPSEPSYEEISAQLGMPKGSIGPTRNRCIAQLRGILVGMGFSDIL